MSEFASLATIFGASFLIALSGAMMPGPLLTATISESSRRGAHAGPVMIAGHAILEFLLVVLLISGFAAFLQKPGVFVLTAFAGSGILIYMAAGMLSSLSSLTFDQQPGATGRNNLLLSGILMSIANPYWIMWWATIGMGYILFSWKFGLIGVAFFFAGHIFADLAWYSLISAAVARGRQFLSDRVYRGFIAILAVFLILFALFFAFQGFIKVSELI